MPSPAVGAFSVIFLQLISTDFSNAPSLVAMLKWKVSVCFFDSAFGAVGAARLEGTGGPPGVGLGRVG